MLNQIGFANATLTDIGKQIAHHFQLMIAREKQGFLFEWSIFFFTDQLGKVFDDVGQTLTGENFLPQVIALVSIRIGRIPLAVIISLIEWQKIGTFTRQSGSHKDFIGINSKMNQTSTELEQDFVGITVFPILLDGMIGCLPRPGVL